MKTVIKVYNEISTKVTFFFKQLHLTISKSTGRKLSIAPEETIAMMLFKQSQGIETKKSIWKIFEPKCSYKTLVVNMNKLAIWAFLILQSILKWNQKNSHIVKHTDSTDIPVCLTKNGSRHKTMRAYATWAHGPKGWYYGLKLSITTDLKRNLLAVSLNEGNSNDRTTFRKMKQDISPKILRETSTSKTKGFCSQNQELI